MTYPLLLVLKRDVSLRRVVERLLSQQTEAPLTDQLCARLQQRLVATGSVRDCRALARKCADDAIACLTVLPEGPGRTALAALAAAADDRER